MKRQITFFSALLFSFLLQPEEVISFTFLGDHLCRHDDAVALLQFKEIFSISAYASCDHSYPKTTHWKADTDCCNWDGVTCHNLTGRVIGLDLSCGQLQGVIHPNSTLFHLSHLRCLNLTFNNFTGSRISHRFGSLKSLTHLNLSCSNFEGEVVSEISHLSNLISLDLSDNELLRYEPSNFDAMLQNLTHLRELSLWLVNISSELRVNFSSSLTYLDLSYTKIRGNLPSNVFHLPNMRVLRLGGNENLTISLPKLNCSISDSLRQLNLSRTNFSAALPDLIGCIGSLNSLDLGFYYLSYLNLSLNFLTGTIDQLPITPSLEYLDVSSNSLQGPIPSSICKASLLKILDLSTNNLSGPIPQCLGNFSQQLSLRFLKLNDNQLQGSVPRSLAHCEDLELLDLGNNEIDDKFPVWLEILSNLEVLILRSNYLSGTFPTTFSKGNSLCGFLS
ncbi:unnamed protein product [Coffea canephora]|uniref:Leucine-rich repeat-containing N-terminal plant-type domain-containing protein n=1 Tax=Coffea canephora TaxID=49390 RepID=A0A068V4B0_COFCA|nr:unnamed protein product [Coffea canephora]